MVGGVNEMIRQQREINPELSKKMVFDIVKFNSKITFNKSGILASVPFMQNKDYIPGGCTALYDAVGMTINKYMDEKNVVVVIATDGGENASKEYNHKQVTEMISTCAEENKWKFIYLSENLDTYKQGNSIGISNNTTGCGNTAVGLGELGTTLTSGSCNTAVGSACLGQAVDLTKVGFIPS